MASRSRAEQETVIRFDQESNQAWLATWALPVARRWERCGYTVQQVAGEWRTVIPKGLVSFRRVRGADVTNVKKTEQGLKATEALRAYHAKRKAEAAAKALEEAHRPPGEGA